MQTPCSLSSPLQWDHLTSLLSQGLPYRGLSLDRLATQIATHRPQLEHLHVATLVQEYADDNAYVRGHGTEGIVSLLDITKDEPDAISPFKLHFWKQRERGSVARGPTYNWKKTQVCKVNYKPKNVRRLPRAESASST